MMLFKNIDIWHIVFYDELALINKLNNLKISFYNFKKIDKYKFYIEVNRKNRRKIKNNFIDSKIVSKRGILSYFELLVSKTTIFCLVIAGMFMYNVSKRIWRINIVGDYDEYTYNIKECLREYNLRVSNFYPSNDELKEIENKIALYLTKEIEFLEIKRSGAVLNVRYQKRRVASELPIKGGSLYATKDGMIRYFNVQSGVKKVKEYDYVKKGDLLVSDVVETSSNELINVGTLGSVYANTFYVIEVNVSDENLDEASMFSTMLDKAKKKISTYLSKDEKIEIERVLEYKIENNKGYMKVYYMLLEDITI